ncbi:MAG: hypothetical protein PHS93_08370 [Candidatus Omnitrophica bacterium]|nr:hypothetical protein [Candidatus Omnitrophota bacterium]MDD5353157.1 hypothetical protein [Candidatus Omnitrophota bacterium]MDD5551137.1 hypothetical protein [Candidatus Omnitrophota bacterium]
MKTQIGLVGSPEVMGVKETYQTIKRRLFSESDFIEMTNAEGKLTISKSVIGMIAPIVKRVEEKKPVNKQKKF